MESYFGPERTGGWTSPRRPGRIAMPRVDGTTGRKRVDGCLKTALALAVPFPHISFDDPADGYIH